MGGIEPPFSAYETDSLPLKYTPNWYIYKYKKLYIRYNTLNKYRLSNIFFK